MNHPTYPPALFRAMAPARARLAIVTEAMKREPDNRRLWHVAEEIRLELAEIDRRFFGAGEEAA